MQGTLKYQKNYEEPVLLQVATNVFLIPSPKRTKLALNVSMLCLFFMFLLVLCSKMTGRKTICLNVCSF